MRRLIASWFGTGLLLGKLRGSDAGSGTLAAAATLVIALWLHRFGWPVQLAAGLVTVGLSLWASAPFADDDPGWVVVDEAAGMFVATVGLGGWPAVVAFVVFRIGDISKKLPGVGAADRMHGPVGLTFDDVIAGLYALAAGWLATLVL